MINTTETLNDSQKRLESLLLQITQHNSDLLAQNTILKAENESLKILLSRKKHKEKTSKNHLNQL